MKISIVVAVGSKNEIGANGELLWRLPKDMQYFKEITYGHHVLMGRKTYESIPPKFRPLSGRVNIVVTRDLSKIFEGCKVVSSVEEGIKFAKDSEAEELMIIGGGEIYKSTFEKTDKVYLTQVEATFPNADVFFPEIKKEDWKIISNEKHIADEKHKFDFEFLVLERN
jgi:dihydrofolate reductase